MIITDNINYWYWRAPQIYITVKKVFLFLIISLSNKQSLVMDGIQFGCSVVLTNYFNQQPKRWPSITYYCHDFIIRYIYSLNFGFYALGYFWRKWNSIPNWWNHWNSFSRISLCNTSLCSGIFSSLSEKINVQFPLYIYPVLPQ